MRNNRLILTAVIAVSLLTLTLATWSMFREHLTLPAPPIFRELTNEEIANNWGSGQDLLEINRQHNIKWFREILILAKKNGWAQGATARRISELDAMEIDSLLVQVIKSDDGIYLPEAFQVLTIFGSRLRKSSVEFRAFLEKRLVGDLPIRRSYAGTFVIGVVQAISRLAQDGDLWMQDYLATMRQTGSIENVTKTQESTELMFRVICGYAPISPTKNTMIFLESMKGKYPYAQRRIDLIDNYLKSGDSYQGFIIEMIERSPGENKYVPKLIQSQYENDLPSVKEKASIHN